MARTPGAQTISLNEKLFTYWVHLQAALRRWLSEGPDGPLMPRHKQLVAVLGVIWIEALLPAWPVLAGRPLAERAALACAFVAMAVLYFPTTRLLITFACRRQDVATPISHRHQASRVISVQEGWPWQVMPAFYP